MQHECMPICFWCTKETGKPVMLPEVDGKIPPKKAILSYEPCDACKAMFAQGIHVIGVVDKPLVETMPPIVKDGNVELYPTGSFFVASEPWTEEMLKKNGKQDMLEDVLKRKVLMMPEEIVSKIIAEADDVPTVGMPDMEEDNNADNGN